VTQVARFLALAPADRRLFLQAAIAVPLVRTALRVVGFRRCQAALNRLTPVRVRPAAAPPVLDDVTRLARLVRAAAHHGVVDRNCLTESMAIWWLLRRCGLESDIRIGVRIDDDGRLDAHAWVEWAGTALDEHRGISHTFPPLMRPTAS
jgi:hypothetical protein